MQPGGARPVGGGMWLTVPVLRRRRQGFTIVELLIVILIILIIAALVVWAFVKIRGIVRSLGGLNSAPSPPAQTTVST